MAETHEVNIPEVVAEVTAAFERYEEALGTNDVDTLAELFWNSPLTLRYGPNGTLLGHRAIDRFRRNRNIAGVERTLRNTVIKTFGRDFAMADTEATRPDGRMVGRQSQCWVRMREGWRIVSAHVSDIPEEA
ncbi:MAG: oxalurate catabolism protein HpxZ [Defluviicoccus sp.]|nr:oxalurate catabolism protein HpxZ [Defluviicoccus sp.]MDE0275930.1 oxalurate catabolism protein HpxZ [Defluviicoccus sp.]